MKTIHIAIAFILLSQLTFCASLIIHLQDGGQIEFELSEISEITFSENLSVTDFINIYQQFPRDLLINYPNPFNSQTNIKFELKENGHCSVEIYNLLGQKIDTLIKGEMHKGVHTLTWDGQNINGKNAANGVYLVVIDANDKLITEKIMLLK